MTWPGKSPADGRCRAEVPSGADHAGAACEEARTSSLSSSDRSRPLSASRSPTHCPVPNTAPTGASVFRGVADARPGIPGKPARCATGGYTYTEAGELLAVYDRSNTQCALSRMTRSTRAGWWGTVMRKAGDALPLRRYRAGGGAAEPAGLSYRYLYEQDRITITDS